jgi:WD40 repeat protein
VNVSALFISHSSQDNALAAELCDQLAAAGYSTTFLDVDPRTGLIGGHRWEDQLYQQLRGCQALVFLATPSAMQSQWCFAEIVLARSIGKPVIPLSSEPDPRFPLLADTQTIYSAKDDQRWAMLLRSLRSLGVTPDLSFEWDHTRNPYPGLEAFQPGDAAVFFGRDNEISAIVGRLRPTIDRTESQAVTVVGPSGSGKSSLVRAGVVARLRHSADFHVLPPLNPGNMPVAALAGALATGWPQGPPGSRRRLGAWISDGDDGALVDYVTTRMDELGGNRRLLVVVDQLEEMLHSDVDIQRSFLAALAAIQVASTPVTTVLTVRSHFLESCQLVAPSGFLSHLVGVTTLDRPRLATAMRRPAQLVGVEIADDVVEAVLAEAGAGDLMPLMAYTMRKLFEDLAQEAGRIVTLARYERLGGVVGAMSGQADVAFSNVVQRHSPEEVWRTLLKVVAVGADREPVRRTALLSTMDERERDVMEAFVDARLLSVDDESRVGVAHEALLRQWAPLVTAIDEAAGDLLIRTELESAARRWLSSSRSPARLLTGDRMDEALLWALENPFDLDDLPEVEEYLRASQTARRDLLARRAAAAAEHVLSGYPADLSRQEAIMLELTESFSDVHAVELAARAVRDRDLLRSVVDLPTTATGALAISRSGTVAATATVDGRILVFNLLTMELDGVVRIGPEPVTAIALLGSTGEVVCAREHGIESYEWRTDTVRHRLDHPGRLIAMCSDGSDTLISLDEHGSVRAWANGEQFWRHDFPNEDIRELVLVDDTLAGLDASGALLLITRDGNIRPGASLHPPAAALVGVENTGFMLIDETAPRSESNRLTTVRFDGEVSSQSWQSRRIIAASVSTGFDRSLVVMADGTAFIAADDEDEEEELRGFREPVHAATWAPTLQAFVTAGGSELMVWRRPSSALLTARLSRGIRELCWSHDGATLISVGRDGAVSFWQVQDSQIHEVAASVGEYDMVARPVWSFDDSWIVTLHPNYALLRPWPSGADVIEIPMGSAPVDCAFAGSDGSRLIVALEDGPAKVWDWATGTELAELPASAGVSRLVGSRSRLYGIDPKRSGVLVWEDLSSPPVLRCEDRSMIDASVAEDGRVLAVAADGTLLTLLADGDVQSTDSGDPLACLGWWPSSGLAVGLGADDGFVVRDVTGQTTTITGPRYTAVAVRNDGLLAAGDATGWLEVRSLAPGETSSTKVTERPAHTASLVDVHWSSDDSALVAMTERSVRIYPVHAVDKPVMLDALRGVGIRTVVSQTDGTIVCAMNDGSVLGYHYLDGRIAFELPPGSVPDPVLACHAGDGFMTAERDGRLRRWSTDGQELGAMKTGLRPLSLSMVAADRWALLSDDGTVTLGSAMDEIARWPDETSSPAGVKLSPDGTRVALIDADGLRILPWTRPDAAEPELPRIEGASCAAWSPDGRLLAIGSNSGSIELRAVDSWQSVHRIPGSERTTCLSWSTSGRFLTSGTGYGLLTLVEHIGMGDVTEWLKSRVTRRITADERDRYGIPATLHDR